MFFYKVCDTSRGEIDVKLWQNLSIWQDVKGECVGHLPEAGYILP